MRHVLCLLVLLCGGCLRSHAQGPGRSGRATVDRATVDQALVHQATVDRALVDQATVDRVLVDQATADAALAKASTSFPKFTHAFNEVNATDPLIKRIDFFRQGGGPGGGPDRGPAFASPAGVIEIDLGYLDHPRPNFDDNRLVVVLYHELGHLHYFVTVPRAQWTSDNSEQAAFEYSLLRTKQLAEAGDCGPLATGVRFMKLRSEGTNLADPHVRALKLIVTEPLYAGYVDYVGTHCTAAAGPGQPPTASDKSPTPSPASRPSPQP